MQKSEKVRSDRSKLMNADFSTAKEVWDRRQGMLRCFTGSKNLDAILGGGSIDQAGEDVVTVIPSYQVVSWNYSSEPKTLDFNLTATGGSVSCEIIIPLNVMHGSFRVFVDEDSGWNGYSVAYNSTHIILMLSYELANGVHNIKVVEGVLMYPMGDLDDNGVVNILDISKVAKYWGRHR